MAKRKTTRTTLDPTDAPREDVTGPHRISTHPANGDPSSSQEVAPGPMPIGEAMRLAIQELGDVVIDDTLAPQQMRELAECYDEVTKARVAYTAKAEAAKVAKQALESSTNLLLEKVRGFTHPTPMPLFDAHQAEADREAMLAAQG